MLIDFQCARYASTDSSSTWTPTPTTRPPHHINALSPLRHSMIGSNPDSRASVSITC